MLQKFLSDYVLYKYGYGFIINQESLFISRKEFYMYEFTDDCLIHIEEIDNEHRHLFSLINESIAMVAEASDVTTISKKLVSRLKDYAVNHFAHEEAYMESIHDPELSLQKREHAAFTEKINSFTLDTSSPEAAKESLNELLKYLIRWLYRHILSSDMMIGKLEPNDPFAFTDRFKTGIQLIDDEHRKLFEIIKETNELICAELLHDKYDRIMELLAKLKDYTEFHFHDEETLMERIGYPGLESQKHAHAAFVERLVDVDLGTLDDIDNDQQAYLLDLINYLIGWLSNHILVSDKKIAEYVRSNNITL